MSDYIKQYVIVGNGVAGMIAAEEIRKIDKSCSIKLLSLEKYLTYYRVKLSHYISRDFEPQELLIHNESWYKDRNIEVILGATVSSIDAIHSTVILENGETISYNKLLLANGSSSFVPPVQGQEKKGVFALRSLNDLKNIQNHLTDCEAVSVIGGGLLGLEAAWALKEKGLAVNIVEFFPTLLPRQLDEELANYVKEKLEKLGLRIHLSSVSQEILGNERVTGIALKDGRTINSDMILFSTGIKPNIEIAQGTTLATNKGIIVDETMKTSLDQIYAAGDVAEYNGVVMALWSTATDQGKIAAKNMLGGNEAYSVQQPATLLNLGDFSMFSVGEVKANSQNMSYHKDNVFHKLFIEDGKLVGGVLTGNVKKMGVLKKAVNERKDLSELLEKGLDVLETLDRL